jgi:anti-anti-sigma factor
MAKKSALKRIAITGEFTIFNAGAVRDQLLAALEDADEIEVDLAQAVEIDSAGLQLMVAAKREAVEKQKTLRFTCHSPAVLDALDLTDLSAYFGDPVLLPSRP